MEAGAHRAPLQSGPEPVDAVYDRAYGVSLCKPLLDKSALEESRKYEKDKTLQRPAVCHGFQLARKVPNKTDRGIARGSGASRNEKPLILQYVFLQFLIEGGISDAVESSLTFHKLTRRKRAPAYKNPRIRPGRSSAPLTSLIPDWHPLKVTTFVRQTIEKSRMR